MKNKFYILILLASLFFAGCKNDFLEEIHPTQVTGDSFFESDDDAEAAALGLYEYTRNLYFGRDMIQHFASDFDMFAADNFTLPKKFYKNSIVTFLTLNYNEEESHVSLAWSSSYTTIYRANWIIDNVTDNENISDQVKKETLAQAYFFRGFCYFTLVRFFEEVPLMLSQTTPDTYYPEKATNEECWNQVFSDYQKALDLGGLPAPTENYVDGKINTGVVNAMMARACLYLTKPGSTEYWDKVKQYTAAVESLNKYALEPIDDFSKFFVYTAEDTWVKNKEMIWVHGFSYGPTYGGTPFLYDGNNYAGLAYMSMPVGRSAVILKNDKDVSYLVGNGMSGRAYYAASTDLSDIMIDYYSKGDKRTSEYLFYPTYNDYGLDGDGEVYLKETVNADSLYNKIIETDGAEGEYLHFKKFMIREFVGDNMWDGGFNHSLVFPIIRYADICLMRAEAEYRLGNESVAKTYLKKVTDRAGFASDYLDSFSGEGLLDEILQQRRVELVHESLRGPDLKRLDHFKPPYIGTYPGSVTWDEKLSVLPVPNRELDANPNLVQHDLWK